MPLYAYRCRQCSAVTDSYSAKPSTATDEAVDAVPCASCASSQTYRIIGRVAYHASDNAKTARLDPKYEKMVQHSLGSSPLADPDRLLKKMTPYDGAQDG